jgi:putative flippase GtrA
MANVTPAVILIPAYEPTESFVTFTRELTHQLDNPVIVVDDGSGSQFSGIFEQIKPLVAQVISYPDNRGKGAALKVGFAAIMADFPDTVGVVTADSDGQHRINDIETIAGQLSDSQEQLILGTRNFTRGAVPFKSYWGNTLTSKATQLAIGTFIPDTQTGLRGIPARVLGAFLQIAGDRFEYEMNMLLEAKTNGLDFVFTPIETVYVGNNEQTHFHPVRDSFLVYRQFLKFLVSGLSSAAVDVALFASFFYLLFQKNPGTAFVAGVLARLLSGVYNFLINHFWVFQNGRAALGKNGSRYVTLFLVQMLVSSALTWLAANWLPGNTVLWKIVFDALIFFGSYLIQKHVVFRG